MGYAKAREAMEVYFWTESDLTVVGLLERTMALGYYSLAQLFIMRSVDSR